MIYRIKTIAIILVLLNALVPCFASTSKDGEEVKAFLDARLRYGSGKLTKRQEVKDLKHLGDNALPALAELLPDYDLGDTAADVMREIDPQKSAPLIFRSMPKSDRNVQYHTFVFYIRLIRSGQPFTYSREMHDAAIRCLQANTESDAAGQALLAIGLTGSTRDFPLLTKYYENKNPTGVWRRHLHNAAESSLARLGNKRHLENIAHELRMAIPAERTYEWAEQLSDSIRKAAFSNNKQFIPLLCKHLYTPTPEVTSDALPSQPSQEAANALSQLVNGSSPDKYASIDYWKVWCAKSQKK